MGIVGMNDGWRVLADDAGELPRGGQVDLAARREPHQVGAFGRACEQLALRVGDEHRAVPAFAQPEHGQQRLLLSAAPGAGRVDVEAEHSSQSLASFKPT